MACRLTITKEKYMEKYQIRDLMLAKYNERVVFAVLNAGKNKVKIIGAGKIIPIGPLARVEQKVNGKNLALHSYGALRAGEVTDIYPLVISGEDLNELNGRNGLNPSYKFRPGDHSRLRLLVELFGLQNNKEALEFMLGIDENHNFKNSNRFKVIKKQQLMMVEESINSEIKLEDADEVCI